MALQINSSFKYIIKLSKPNSNITMRNETSVDKCPFVKGHVFKVSEHKAISIFFQVLSKQSFENECSIIIPYYVFVMVYSSI